MGFWEEAEAKLKAPFPLDDIEFRIGSRNQDKTRGMMLAYVTNRAIQNRLDSVFGINNWKNQFERWSAEKGNICYLSVREPGTDEWITKSDGSSDSDMEAFKGGLSDAMKRAAYHFGIGRYLYDLPTWWVGLKYEKYPADGEEDRVKAAFPKWALPEGSAPGKKAHWIKNKKMSDAFYKFIEDNKISEEDYMQLLGVENSVEEYQGTAKEASELLKKFVAERDKK